MKNIRLSGTTKRILIIAAVIAIIGAGWLWMQRELVDAVDNPEIYGGEWPPTNIPDLIFIANLVAESRNPFSPEDEDFRQGLARAATLGLDEARLAQALAESAEERQALMALFHVG